MFSAIAKAPTIPNQQEIDSLAIIQGNTLKGYNVSSNGQTLGFIGESSDKTRLKELVWKKYPTLANLLICMWGRESSYGRDKNIKGDNGFAYGDFQIHIDKHDITEWCAMDFECSLDFCYNKIKQGQGWLWSSYPKCL